MSDLKILIAGRNGQVGHELGRSLLPLGHVIAPDRSELDLREAGTIAKVVRQVSPNIIVNAAAYTAVDAAEGDEATAHLVNANAVAVLAEEARKLGAFVIHYSTDYVFDGTKKGPYLEQDETSPINAYGRSKLAGEEALLKSGCHHLILRTSWVYGRRGKNFLRTILKLCRERDTVRVVDDQYGAPTWSRNIADATAHILHQCRDQGLETLESGTFHLASSGATTWHGFAVAALSAWRSLHPGADMPACEIIPIVTSEYPTPAARPKNSCLDTTALTKRFHIRMPAWGTALERCLEDMIP